MPRNGSGTAIPPVTVNPVSPGTTITSNWANTTVTDTYNELTNSLPRDGQAPMTAPLKVIDGSVTIPGFAFNSEASTGVYRPSTGVLAFTASGVEPMRVNSAGRVLLGTPTDDGVNRLQVNGNVAITGNESISGTLGVTGTSTLGVTNTGALASTTGAFSSNVTVTGTLTATGGISGPLSGITNLSTTGNTILGDATTDTLSVGNGGLIKDASGNVGIGVSPLSLLHIRGGNAIFRMEATGGTPRTYAIGTNLVSGVGEWSVYDYTAGIERLRISPAGHLSASGNFDLGGSIRAQGNLLFSNATSGVSLGTAVGQPGIILTNAGAGADAKTWDAYADATTMHWRVVNDANSFAPDWLSVTRSGATVTNIMFPNGNVGIGVSPAVKFEVAGTSMRFTGTGADASFVTFTPSISGSSGVDIAASYFGSGGYGPLRFTTGGAERMRIDATGNLGIGGTAAASARLDVFGSGIVQFRSNTTTSVIRAYSATNTTNTDFADDASGGYISVSGARNLLMHVNGANRLQIDSSGNVYPGSNAGQTLGGSSNRWSTVFASALSDGSTGANTLIDSSSTTLRIGVGSGWATQTFYTGGLERLRIDLNGNIGVNTTAANFTGYSTLEVKGRASGAGGVFKTTSSSGTTSAEFFVLDSNGVNFGSATSSPLLLNIAGVERARIDTSGNLGIGTSTTTGARLTVAGGTGILVNGNGAAGYNVTQYVNDGGKTLSVGVGGSAAGGWQSNAAAIGTVTNDALAFGTNGTLRMNISAAGVITDGMNELGYKGLPSASVTTGSFVSADRGKCVYATAGVTVPNNTMATGDVVTIVNTTGSAITITASVGTLRQAGTANTGNRTLAAYGIASVLFVSSTLAFISGQVS